MYDHRHRVGDGMIGLTTGGLLHFVIVAFGIVWAMLDDGGDL